MTCIAVVILDYKDSPSASNPREDDVETEKHERIDVNSLLNGWIYFRDSTNQLYKQARVKDPGRKQINRVEDKRNKQLWVLIET